MEGKVPEMTAQQLFEWTPLTKNATQSSLYRMSVGYRRPGQDRYERVYVRRVPTLRGGSLYKLLEKGSDFITRMDKTRPKDTSLWLNELLVFRQSVRNIHTTFQTRSNNTNK